MLREALEAIVADRSPLAWEAEHLSHLAEYFGSPSQLMMGGAPHLLIGETAARWWLAVAVDEPTLLLSGEGSAKAWGFVPYGVPADAALVRQRQLVHQSGQLVTLDGPAETKETGRLHLKPAQSGPPAGASWAIWPRPPQLTLERLKGAGAATRLFTAAALAIVRAGQGSVGAVFFGRSRLSARALTSFLHREPPGGVIWLAALSLPAAEPGRGAFHLRAAGAPGAADLDHQLGQPPARFMERDQLPGWVLEIRRAGWAEYGLGVAAADLGAETESVHLADGEDLYRILAAIGQPG